MTKRTIIEYETAPPTAPRQNAILYVFTWVIKGFLLLIILLRLCVLAMAIYSSATDR